MTRLDEAGGVTGTGLDAVGHDDEYVSVDWEVRTGRRLERLGLGPSVSGSVDVVVLDRRGETATPAESGELTVDGRRVVVVPDRSGAGPPVEAWVAGGRERYEAVVDVLRRTVALDASIERAFDAARQPRAGDDERTTDRGSTGDSRAIERAIRAFEDADAALAVGGFAVAVEPLR